MTALTEDRLDTAFLALADPTRRSLLARLSVGDATVGELAAPFAMSVQAVSKHLTVLEQAGLITRRREAQRRPCSLNREAIGPLVDWLDAFRRRTEEKFARLDEVLARDLSPTTPSPAHPDREE
ncbi:helix-turn-helix transcriptional regulator [Naasia sp. SYSU D00057]|uniref:ArsR/SmtB family transcription factor n=1 Tax=Naasia sp. SYSU D00057 TaxID=2817380 RepID=UPI001B306F05|nr:metalloregulator ArsR/SmtB family transcription factor [Naasia sp. SYSU D00057]